MSRPLFPASIQWMPSPEKWSEKTQLFQPVTSHSLPAPITRNILYRRRGSFSSRSSQTVLESREPEWTTFVPGFTYKFADGYLQPYGDYFELDIDSAGKTVALWGEGSSYIGPGNVWFARQQ